MCNKFFTDPITCEVCGEEGHALTGTGYKAWLGGKFYHKDPRVCADNLRRQREKLERERASQEEDDDVKDR